MDDEVLHKAKKILDKWEERRPRETPEKDVQRLLQLLEFEIHVPARGSHFRACHELLRNVNVRLFGQDGGVTFVPHHSKRLVSWFDLKEIMLAARTVIDMLEESQKQREGES